MPQITITVHNKPYTLSCPAGNESHVERLAGHVNAYIDNLVKHGANLSNQGLLVFALLGMAEKIEDLQAKIAELDDKLNNPLASLGLSAPTPFVQDESADGQGIIIQSDDDENNNLVENSIAQVEVTQAEITQVESQQTIPETNLKPVSQVSNFALQQQASHFPTLAASIAAVTGTVVIADAVIDAQLQSNSNNVIVENIDAVQSDNQDDTKVQEVVSEDLIEDLIEDLQPLQDISQQSAEETQPVIEAVQEPAEQSDTVCEPISESVEIVAEVVSEVTIENASLVVPEIHNLSDVPEIDSTIEPLDLDAERSALAFLEATTQSLEQWQSVVSDTALNDNVHALKQKQNDISVASHISMTLEQEMQHIASETNKETPSVSQQVSKSLDMAEDSNRLLNDVLDRISNLARKLESAD